MKNLPEDVVHLIATELESYPKTLSQLCLIDKQSCSGFLRFLYRRVILFDPHRLEKFCRSLCTSHFQTSKLVRSLRLGMIERFGDRPNLKIPAGLVPGLQFTLLKMESLEDLFLDSLLLSAERILDNLVGPFRLKRFSCPYSDSQATMSFLESQPTITEITFSFLPEPDDISTVLDTDLKILPALRRLKAHRDVIARLVPGRPVSHISILYDLEIEQEVDLSSWARSTVPITSISLHDFDNVWTNVRRFIVALESAGIASAVKQFTVIEVSRSYGPLTRESHPRQLISKLSGLCSLKRLEVVCLKSENWKSEAQIREWLGSMTSIGEWQKHMGTLKQISIYGVDIK
ncbi:hypothetical protein BDV93DRAFT_608378 [Ceratobasidium sp. AG-I]|nr:hypothetical protein BDV93DRAFT_608378 [Ceratobasidium sp. AG-I]